MQQQRRKVLRSGPGQGTRTAALIVVTCLLGLAIAPTESAGAVERTSQSHLAPRAAPGAPTVVSVGSEGLGVLVEWAPNGPQSAVAHYDITASPVITPSVSANCKSSVASAAPGSSTMVIIRGVCPHVAYTVSMTETTSGGTSSPSNVSNPVVPNPASPPSIPLVSTVIGRNHSLIVSWLAPSYDGGSAVTSYLLGVSAAGKTSKSVTTSEGARGTTIIGLTNGTSYSVALRAVNAVGKSPAATGQGIPLPNHAPGVPTQLSAVPTGAKGVVQASWVAPVDDGGTTITSYVVTSLEEVAKVSGGKITYAPAPGARPVAHVSSSTIINIGGLSTSKVFFVFKVAARNSSGMSKATPYSNPITLQSTLNPKTRVLSASVLGHLTSVSASSLTFKYAASSVPNLLKGLKKGDVLVGSASSATPLGILRTVTAVSVPVAGTYVVQTGPASLASVFGTLATDVSSGSPAFTKAGDSLGLARFIPSSPGVSARIVPHASFSTSLALSYDFSGQLSTTNPGTTAQGTYDIQGTVDLTPSVDFEANIVSGWLGLPTGVNMSMTTYVGIARSETSSFSGGFQHSFPVGPGAGVYPPALPDLSDQAGKYCLESFVVPIGPVPFLFTPCIEVNLNVSATGAITVSTSTSFLWGNEVSVSASLTGPSTISTTDLSQTPTTTGAPTTKIGANVQVSAGLEVKADLFIDAYTGPYVDATVALDLKADTTANPWLSLSLTGSVAVGWQLVIPSLGVNVQLQDSLDLPSYLLWSATGPPPTPLAVTPPASTVSPGDYEQFTANGGTGGVTWSLVGQAGDTISASGLFQAAAPGGRAVTVVATDSSGTVATALVVIGSGIGAPSNFVANAEANQTSADLSWTPPPLMPGQSIDLYAVTTSPVTTTSEIAGAADSTTIGNLLPDTNYVVTIIAETSDGFESPPASAEVSTFSRNPTSTCATSNGSATLQLYPAQTSGLSISINGEVLAPPGTTLTAIDWTWGDDSSLSPGCNYFPESHTYSNPGTYTVTVSVTGTNGFQLQQTEQVTVPASEGTTCSTTNGTPTLQLFTPQTSGLTASVNGVVIAPTGTTLTGIDWNWGDGSSQSSCDYFPQTHTYATAGTYTVTVAATGTNGFNLQATEKVTVPYSTTTCSTTNGSPSLQLFTPSTSGLTATVSGVVIAPDGSTLTGIDWDWGDGVTQSGCVFFPQSHTYSSPGTYTLTVTATGTNGFELQKSEQVTVPGSGPTCQTTNGTPTLNLFTPQKSGLSVTISGVVIVSSGSLLTGIDWNWGDGTTQTGCAYFPESHAYANPGTYEVTVTTPGTNGFFLQRSVSVTVP